MKKALSIIGNILLYVAVFFILNQLVDYGFLAVMSVSPAFDQFVRMNLASINIVFGIIALSVYMLIFKLRKQNFAESCGFKKLNNNAWPYMLIIGITLGLFSTAAVQQDFIVKYAPMLPRALKSIIGSKSIIVCILGPVVMGTLLEEVLCRGLVFNQLRRGMNDIIALVLQGLIFGAVFGDVAVAVYVALGAFIFGLTYMWTKTIWASIYTHAASSLMLVILSRLDGLINSGNSVIVMVFSALVMLATVVFMGINRKKVETV